MKTKHLIVAALMSSTFQVFAQAPKAKNKTDAKKPNLLFIITDQQRYDALSIAGNTILQTPNLDRLAKRGAYFSKAYTPMAVCAPARATILTGRTVEHTGILNNELADAAKSTRESGVMSQKTFDEILAENGYKVEYYGKFHSPMFHSEVYTNPELKTKSGETIFGHGMRAHYLDFLAKDVPMRPLQPGEFKDTYSNRGYTANPLDKRFNMGEKPITNFGQSDLHGKLNIPEEYSITAQQAKETIAALDRLKDKTFSLTCSFHSPHAPMLPTAKYYEMFDPTKMPIAQSISDKMDNSPYKKANGRLDNPEYADPKKIGYMIADYYGLVKEVDDWMGKIIDKLDELKLTDNTLIIFTSDHGEMLGAHGLRAKNVFYEESSRVPLMMSYPKAIKPNTQINNYVSNIDLYSTIFDYLNIKNMESDGRSLRDLIENKPTTRPDYIVTEWLNRGDNEPNYMIVKNGWKMFIPQTSTSKVIDVLYNLNEDPFEMTNLIGNNPNRANYKAKVAELKADLVQWLKEHNSKFLTGVNEREIIKN